MRIKYFIPVLVLVTSSLFAASDYSLFIEAFKQKDYPKALNYIEKAHNARANDDNLTYWYGYTLALSGKHVEGLKYLGKVSSKYKPDDVQRAISYTYYDLIRKAVEKDDFATVEKYYSEAIAQFESTRDKSIDYIYYLLVNYYEKKAQERASVYNSGASSLYQKALTLTDKDLGRYRSYVDKADTRVLSNAFDYYQKNKAREKTAQVHNVYFVGIKHFKGNYTSDQKNRNGKLTGGKKQYGEFTLTADTKTLTRQPFEILKQLVFYYSDGKLLLKAKYHDHDASLSVVNTSLWKSASSNSGKAISEIISIAADLNSIDKPMTRFVLDTVSDTDTYFFVYPYYKSGGIGGPAGLPVVPYTLYSEQRGIVHMAYHKTDFKPQFFMHEFFHNIENRYRMTEKNPYPFVAHAYKPGFKKYWPAWYKGEGELSYYKQSFKKVLNARGFEPLIMAKKTKLTSNQINTVNKLYKKYTLENIRKAARLEKQGNDVYNAKRPGRALSLYKKAVAIYPYLNRANQLLAYHAQIKKDYKQALKYQINQTAVDPDNPAKLEWLGWLYDKNNNQDKALETYLHWSDLSKDPKPLFSIASIYNKKKDYRKATEYFQMFLADSEDDKLRQYALNQVSYHFTYTLKRYAKAVEAARTYFAIIKEKSIKQSVAFNTAVAYSNLQKKQAAIKWLDKAKQLGYTNQNNLEYYYRLNR